MRGGRFDEDARGAAARPRLHEPLLRPPLPRVDAQLAHVPDRRALRPRLRHGHRDRPARDRRRRRHGNACRARHRLAADPVRRRHVADGHGRRRVHVPRLRLGLLEPRAQGLLQPHRHDAVGRRRALDRHRRAAAGRVEPARAQRRLLGRLDSLDFETLGYGIVALFVLTWAMSVTIWKPRRIEERWTADLPPPV